MVYRRKARFERYLECIYALVLVRHYLRILENLPRFHMAVAQGATNAAVWWPAS